AQRPDGLPQGGSDGEGAVLDRRRAAGRMGSDAEAPPPERTDRARLALLRGVRRGRKRRDLRARQGGLRRVPPPGRRLPPFRVPSVTMLAIRPATLADHDVLVDLLTAQLREHAIETSPPALARAVDGLLRDPERGRLLVATIDGTPVGVAALSFVHTLEHADRSAWLEELYVAPAHREGGIGTALLGATCDAAAAA